MPRRIVVLALALALVATVLGVSQHRNRATASPSSATSSASGSTAQRFSEPAAVTVNGTRFRPVRAVPDPPVVLARAWAVADLDTGAILGVHRHRAQLPMASTIKLLSAVTAARTVPAFPDHRVMRREANPDSCTCAGLEVGAVYTRRALLAGMLLPSGNDAAEALAGSHPDGRAAFIRAMNRVAAELGAQDTHAANPSGLTAPGAYSSARDLLSLLRAAQAEPVVEPLLDLASFRFGPRDGHKHTIWRSVDYVNTYLERWPGTQGKSGFTTPAKNTLVVNTPLRGHRIGVAILGAPPGTITRAAKQLTVWAARNHSALVAVGQLPS